MALNPSMQITVVVVDSPTSVLPFLVESLLAIGLSQETGLEQ